MKGFIFCFRLLMTRTTTWISFQQYFKRMLASYCRGALRVVEGDKNVVVVIENIYGLNFLDKRERRFKSEAIILSQTQTFQTPN